MSQRKFIAEQYQLNENKERGQQVDTIHFTADPIYKNMQRVIEKKLEKRPANGYEVIIYWAVGYRTPNPKKAFSYRTGGN